LNVWTKNDIKLDPMKLSVTNHDRDAVGMRYVYPVVSRRAGGVSVGINLSPNNACNWRCVYCQVPDLVYGKGPPIDMDRLEAELRSLLESILHGDFMERHVPEGARRLTDLALSGNGEPTNSPHFVDTIELVGRLLLAFDLLGSVPPVLITNGSRMDNPAVAQGLRHLAELGGEVWFKLDSATSDGAGRIHGIRVDADRHIGRLKRSAELCTTWIQTCVFGWSGQPPSASEQEAYLACMRSLIADAVPVRGVLLYGLARPPQQPDADALSTLPHGWLEEFAERIRATGMPVRLSL
jgi:wyosine [tRNA(Phe)-imidazoG37] synthetase (radical SAM superfamily)